MSFCENPTIIYERPQQRRKTHSFSSSLLEAIYLSIDEPKEVTEQRQEENFVPYKRNNAIEAEEEITNIRRAMMIEKWMKNYKKYTQSFEQLNADSNTTTDSSKVSFSETKSASKCEGKFIMRTKLRALKIYADLKKVKQPISPGGKIANFLNSIFNSRYLKKDHQNKENLSTLRKSKSVKESTMTCSLTSRTSCMSKIPFSKGNKSNKCVTFCPVSIIFDENDEPRHKTRSQFMKNPIDGFRNVEENYFHKQQFRGVYNEKCDYDAEEYEEDGKSCASSDLFELENLGLVGVHATTNELPVYGTTSFKVNQAIAKAMVM